MQSRPKNFSELGYEKKSGLRKHHLELNHPQKNGGNGSYFKQIVENVKEQRLDQTGRNYQKMAEIVKPSYEVSLLVIQNLKAHTIAETLILPVAKVFVRRLLIPKVG